MRFRMNNDEHEYWSTVQHSTTNRWCFGERFRCSSEVLHNKIYTSQSLYCSGFLKKPSSTNQPYERTNWLKSIAFLRSWAWGCKLAQRTEEVWSFNICASVKTPGPGFLNDGLPRIKQLPLGFWLWLRMAIPEKACVCSCVFLAVDLPHWSRYYHARPEAALPRDTLYDKPKGSEKGQRKHQIILAPLVDNFPWLAREPEQRVA